MTDMTNMTNYPQENRFPKVHPLMAPEERRALWRSVQAVWQQPTAEVIADIERSRREWDQPPLPR
jgi:hypothetical protein